MNTRTYHTEMHEYRLRAARTGRLVTWCNFIQTLFVKLCLESGRVVHSLLFVSRLCTGAYWFFFWFFFWFLFLCLLMRYIHKWMGDPQWITCWTCVRACSCYMLSGLLWYYYHYYYYYYTHMCVVNATICRGPWACVVCSVRCFCLLGKWRTTLGSWETENLKSWIVS